LDMQHTLINFVTCQKNWRKTTAWETRI
jgi:hypothetical protein